MPNLKPDLRQTTIPSPIGNLTVTFDGDAIILCEFSDREKRISTHLAKYHAGKTVAQATVAESEGAIQVAHRAFAAYFAGDATALEGLTINASGSEFDKKIWAALRTIPAGERWSYGELAEAANSHPRAVGGANGRNPVALITPCHRVIGKDGSLTGYAGGVERKKWLLGMEDNCLI